jgi:hypothetical protein
MTYYQLIKAIEQAKQRNELDLVEYYEQLLEDMLRIAA